MSQFLMHFDVRSSLMTNTENFNCAQLMIEKVIESRQHDKPAHNVLLPLNVDFRNSQYQFTMSHKALKVAPHKTAHVELHKVII